MIDHITVRVNNIDEIKSFYLKALQPLGHELLSEMKLDTVTVLGFGKGEKCDTWFTTDHPTSGPVHIAWRADNKKQVDEFYQCALAAGGQCNGRPGYRDYKPSYYAAYIIDPDGNNVEAVYGND